jgi:hypothetical protein
VPPGGRRHATSRRIPRRRSWRAGPPPLVREQYVCVHGCSRANPRPGVHAASRGRSRGTTRLRVAGRGCKRGMGAVVPRHCRTSRRQGSRRIRSRFGLVVRAMPERGVHRTAKVLCRPDLRRRAILRRLRGCDGPGFRSRSTTTAGSWPRQLAQAKFSGGSPVRPPGSLRRQPVPGRGRGRCPSRR